MKSWQYGIIGVAAAAILAAVIYLVVIGTGEVAATVNGVAIPQSEIDKQVEMVKKQQPQIFEGPAGKQQEQQLRKATLDSMINAELVRQEAEKEGISVTKKDVDQRFDQIKNIFGDDKEFQNALAEQGLNETELRRKIEDQAIQEKMLEHVTGKMDFSNKELKQYYKKNKSQMVEPERKHWRHILTKTEKKAKNVLAELEAGADFAELAKEQSEDTTTKSNGGDLGLRQATDFPPEVATELAKVEVDGFSGVVKGEDGYHVFQLLEVKPERTRPFSEVKKQIEESLKREKQRDKFTAWIEKIKKKAKITTNK